MARPPAPSRRVTDLAMIAPFVGFIVLVPPVIGLFATGSSVFGVPKIILYIFGVWLCLIAIAALLARSLRRNDVRDPEQQ